MYVNCEGLRHYRRPLAMEADLVVEVHRVLLCGLLVPVARRPSLDQVLTGTPSKDNTTLLMGLYKRKTTAQNFLG